MGSGKGSGKGWGQGEGAWHGGAAGQNHRHLTPDWELSHWGLPSHLSLPWAGVCSCLLSPGAVLRPRGGSGKGIALFAEFLK